MARGFHLYEFHQYIPDDQKHNYIDSEYCDYKIGKSCIDGFIHEKGGSRQIEKDPHQYSLYRKCRLDSAYLTNAIRTNLDKEDLRSRQHCFQFHYQADNYVYERVEHRLHYYPFHLNKQWYKVVNKYRSEVS